ncbi:MAG: type II secretion system F family protein [Proteobacteria bacterium]|nr:type II secretion system F family protein [Pseudomonadota bacterium]
MPSFKYKGRDKTGQLVQGQIEAQSQSNAVLKLASVEVVPISIQITSNEVTVEGLLRKYFSFGKPQLDDLILFSQQMHTLLKSGVSLMRALRVVCETTEHNGLRSALTDVIISLESGNRFARALERHPHIFSSLLVAMIDVGENTGQLENAFLQIKVYLESELDTRRRIKTALRYPLTVIVAIVLAIGIINVVVIPSFSNFFTAFGSKLPLPTRILIHISNFVIEYGWLLALFVVGASIGLVVYLHTPQGKWWWSLIKLKIPFIGGIIKRTIYVRFCRAFSMAIKANVPLMQAFRVVSNVVDNTYLAQKILQMRHFVERGESLYLAAKHSELFSPIVLQMLIVGEETGEVDSMLLEAAQYYEKDVDYDLKRLGHAVEPVLIIIIAAMVLVLALGVFLPMWDISTVALRKMDGY